MMIHHMKTFRMNHRGAIRACDASHHHLKVFFCWSPRYGRGIELMQTLGGVAPNWVSKGSGDRQFYRPRGCTAHENKLYIRTLRIIA